MANPVKITFIGDADNLSKTFKQIQDDIKKSIGSLDNFAAHAKKTGDALNKAGKKMSIGATAPLLGFAAASIKLASDNEQDMLKINAAFGKSSKEIDKWANGAAVSLGMSHDDAAATAATFGLLFKQMGVGQKATLSMSEGLTKLATGLATVKKADPVEVQQALTKAMLGKYKALAQYLPTVTKAAVEHEALTETHKKLTKELTQGEMATATYTLAMKAGSPYIDTFSKQQDSAAGRAKILKAQIQDLGDSFGTIMLPAVEAVGGWLSKIATKFSNVSDHEKKIIVVTGLVVASLGPLLTITGNITKAFGMAAIAMKFFQAEEGSVSSFSKAIAFLAENPMVLIVVAIIALIAAIVWLFKHNKAFHDFVIKAWKAISQAFVTAWHVIVGAAIAAWNGIVSATKAAWDFLGGVIKGIGSLVMDYVVPAFITMWHWIEAAWNGIASASKTAWSVMGAIFDVIAAVVTHVVMPVFNLLWQIVKTAFEIIFIAIQACWLIVKPIFLLFWSFIQNVLIPVFNLLWTVVTAVFKGIWAVVKPVLNAIWTVISMVFKAIWNVITTAIGAIINAFSALWSNIGPILGFIGDVFAGMWKAIKLCWSIIEPIIVAIGKFIWHLWTDYIEPAVNAISKVFEVLRNAIAKAWSAIYRAINAAWNIISKIFNAMWIAIKIMLLIPIGLLVAFVWLAWKAISGVVVWAWSAIIKPIWEAIKYYITNNLIPAFQIIWSVIETVFKAIANVIDWAWNNIIKPIWDVISWVISNVLIPIFQTFWNGVKIVWEGISAVISWAWNNIIKPAWDGISYVISNILIPAFQTIWSVIKAVWNGISSAIGSAWDFIKGIFQSIWNWINDNLVPIFQSIWDGIQSGWDAVKDVFGSVYDFVKNLWSNILDLGNSLPGWLKDLIGIEDKKVTVYAGIDTSKVAGPTKSISSSNPWKASKAVGGPIFQGQPTLVGEHGPELIVPKRNGYVMTADQTSNMGSGKTYQITVNARTADLNPTDLLNILKRHEALYAA